MSQEPMETRSAGDIEASTEKLLRDLKAVVRDSEELLRAGARDLSERGVAARERLAAAVEWTARRRRSRSRHRAIEVVVRLRPRRQGHSCLRRRERSLEHFRDARWSKRCAQPARLYRRGVLVRLERRESQADLVA